MALTTNRIIELILKELERSEMRLLSLVVAVRKGLGRSIGIKGDLSAAVASALRKLVCAKVVIDVDGMFALRR